MAAADRSMNTVDVIYRYLLDTRRLIPLTNPRDNYYVTKWRSGSLYVSPKGKLTSLWGVLNKWSNAVARAMPLRKCSKNRKLDGSVPKNRCEKLYIPNFLGDL